MIILCECEHTSKMICSNLSTYRSYVDNCLKSFCDGPIQNSILKCVPSTQNYGWRFFCFRAIKLEVVHFLLRRLELLKSCYRIIFLNNKTPGNNRSARLFRVTRGFYCLKTLFNSILFSSSKLLKFNKLNVLI